MEKLWKNEKIGLIGRDRLLSSKILPRINSPTKRFCIKGEIGVGKTAILEWAKDNTQGNSALFSASFPFSVILDELVDSFEIKLDTKTQRRGSDKEKAILQQKDNTIYVDDLHKASPKLIKFLKVLAERNKLHFSILSGVRYKEELKQLLWGVETFPLHRLKKADRQRLSDLVCLHFGSKISSIKIANTCGGLPGRIVASAMAGEIQKDDARVASEELDIAPIVAIGLCCLALFRYFGRVTDSTDLVLLGGLGMIVAIFGRAFLMKKG